MDKPLKVIESRNSEYARRNISLAAGSLRPVLIALLLLGHVAVTLFPRTYLSWPSSEEENTFYRVLVIGLYPVIALLLICLFGYGWSIGETIINTIIYLPALQFSGAVCIVSTMLISLFAGGSDTGSRAEDMAAYGMMLLIWAALFAILCYILGRMQDIREERKSYYKIVMLFVPMSLLAFLAYPTVR
ncbi:MAG: hypothetical protein ACYDCO_11360 [Armatimonadota bacterium]